MTRRIDLIAVGSGGDLDLLQRCEQLVTDHGHKVRYGTPIFEAHPLYTASDETRFNNLKAALYGDDFDLIWCLRGGCGTSRLLPKLLKLTPPRHKKILIGFSDVTALHLFLSQHWGWTTIHAPTLNYLVDNRLSDESQNLLWDVVKRSKITVSAPLVPLRGAECAMSAPLTGGNLSLVQRSLGTPWQIDARDKMVFLEDINEEPYRIAEMLDHLRHAGIFDDAKAVLLGDFSHQDPAKDKPKLLNLVLHDFMSTIACPVYTGLPVGHHTTNMPLQYNAVAHLSEHILTQTLFQAV